RGSPDAGGLKSYEPATARPIAPDRAHRGLLTASLLAKRDTDRLVRTRLPWEPRPSRPCDLRHILGTLLSERFRASYYAHSARLPPASTQVSTAIRTGYLPWRRS